MQGHGYEGIEAIAPLFFVEVLRGISLKSMRKQVGGSNKSSKKFLKIIDQHQYHEALYVFILNNYIVVDMLNV